MTMNAKTVHAKYGLGVHYTHLPPPPPKKKRACRCLIKVTQRYMLTIVGPGMFDLDI